MWDSAEMQFAGNHPVAAGHFPADPIIPGALLLDHVVQNIASGKVTIRTVKFLAVVRPGAALQLRWRTLEGGAVTFKCFLPDEVLAMSGTLEISAAA
jgi:3-hydroxyacyl-[acyl-carrier-protein] dehydratase